MNANELEDLLKEIAHELRVTLVIGRSTWPDNIHLSEEGPDGAQVFWYHRTVTYPKITQKGKSSRWVQFLLGVHELVHAAWPYPPDAYTEDLSFFGVEWQLVKNFHPPVRAVHDVYSTQIAQLEEDLSSLRAVGKIPTSCQWLVKEGATFELTSLSGEDLFRVFNCATEVAVAHGRLSKLGTFSPLLRREPINLEEETLRHYRVRHCPLRKQTTKQE